MDNDYISTIAQLLRTPKTAVARVEKKMNAVTGKSGVLERMARENDEKVRAVLSRLKFEYYTEKPIASQVFNALIEQARRTDSLLFEHFHQPPYSTELGCEVLIHATSELTGNLRGFYLKVEKARELLEKNPPKNIMVALGYGNDVKKMLANEDIFEIFSALRFVENERWLNANFFKTYHSLKPEDFEQRAIKTLVLPQRWLGIGQKFLGKKLHHMSHLKELGVIFIIPVAEQVPGEILYLFFMTLHYIYEVDWHARLFEKYSQEDNFAEKLVNALKVEVSGLPLPDHRKISWRIISKYLAKKDANDPRLFEPHINTEALHFHRASRAIRKFAERFPNLELDFWSGLSAVGGLFPTNGSGKETLISFDLFDTGISLLQQIGFESKYLYHQEEALWGKMFIEYVGEKEANEIMMNNLDQGYITL